MLRHSTRIPAPTSVAIPVEAAPLRFFEYKATVATFAVAVPFTAIGWLLTVPYAVTPVTFVAGTLLAMGAAVVGVNTWRSGQATRHIGHVINDAENTR